MAATGLKPLNVNGRMARDGLQAAILLLASFAALAGTGTSGSTPLTPVGAIQAATDDGNIPAWTGGLTPNQWPDSYRQRGDRLADPYADDQPLFWLTAETWRDHADMLSAGHQALFKRYPGYRMPVYRSRRSAAFPEMIYAATAANASRAKLIDADTLQGAAVGFPFPQPNSGTEVLWNHRLKYRSDGLQRDNVEGVVYPDGSHTLNHRVERALFTYATSNTTLQDAAMVGYYAGTIISPIMHSGTAILLHEPVNVTKDPVRAWLYNAGQRRVRRTPSWGYDDPIPGTDGMQTADQLDMFHGPLDRYDWTLLGRKPMLIPYNSYRMSSSKLQYRDIATAKHPNPQHTRYELHRVWVVEATVKAGLRHRYARRVFYIDEDSWSIALVDLYDSRGTLWRFQEGHLVSYYPAQTVTALPEVIHDLHSGRYFITAMNNEHDAYQPVGDLRPEDFSVRALRRMVARP